MQVPGLQDLYVLSSSQGINLILQIIEAFLCLSNCLDKLFSAVLKGTSAAGAS